MGSTPARALIIDTGNLDIEIALDDPGVPNWLNPTGRRECFVCMRSYCAVTESAPTMRMVKAAELRKYLPIDTVSITPEERSKALEYRRRGLIKRYGE